MVVSLYLLPEWSIIMRQVFFSFDYDNVWRAMQVRNSGFLKGTQLAGFADAADKEEVKKKSEASIKRWINEQLVGTSVTCVLIDSDTHKSKWVKYEIEKSIEKGNGLLGVYIHNLKDAKGETGTKGSNPFVGHSEGASAFYNWKNDKGYDNFKDWVEEAYNQANK